MKSNRTAIGRFRSRKKLILAIAGLCVVALATAGAVLAVIQTGELANAITVNDGKFKSDGGEVKLKTKGPVRVRSVQTVGAHGFTSGWHTHPGPVLVAMTHTSAGSLTFYTESRAKGHGSNAKCEKTVITADQAYIEKPNTPLLAVNEGAADANWVTTMILPVGAPFASNADAPCNP